MTLSAEAKSRRLFPTEPLAHPPGEQIQTLEAIWHEQGFDFTSIARGILPTLGLEIIPYDNTFDCIDGRQNIDGSPHASRKVAAASFGLLFLTAIDREVSIQDVITEHLDEGNPIYWHDDCHFADDPTRTGCGANDEAERILLTYLTIAKNMPESKAGPLVQIVLGDMTARGRVNFAIQHAAEIDRPDLVVRVATLEGDHKEQDLFINSMPGFTLVHGQNGEQRHFVADMLDVDEAHLALATIAVLNQVNQAKSFGVFWLDSTS